MIRTQPLSNDALFDQKVSELKACADRARTSKWDLVDKLLECEGLLGDRFSQAVEVTKLSPGALNNYLVTGRAWPVALRHLDMPFDSHTALNPLTEDQKTAVMLAAKKAGWNRDDLRLRVAAYKAGDKLAFDPRHKVEATERPARKIIGVPEDHAGVTDEDAPVMDATRAGASMAHDKQPVERERADFTANDANQMLLDMRAAVKKFGTPQGFASRLSGLDTGILDDLIEWLTIVRAEYGPRARKSQAGIAGQTTTATPGRTSSAGTEGDADRRQKPQSPSNRDASADGKASPEAGPQAEASHAGTGSGTLAGHERRIEGEAASADLPTNSKSGCPDQAPDARKAGGGSCEPSASRVEIVDGIQVEQPDDIPANLRR